MNLKKFAEQELAKLGIFEGVIAAHMGVALSVTKAIDAALKNPVVDGVLAVVVPAQLTVHIPQLTAMLDEVVSDLTVGTNIEKDMAGATTTEDKLKVLLTDLQKYGAFVRHALLAKLASMLLAELDSHALTEVEYDTYAQISYLQRK